MKKSDPSPLPTKKFATQKAFEVWLGKNHAKAPGIWLQLYKKASIESGKKSVNYKEALDVALCYGWIDSQKKTHDIESYIQKFTPRGSRSIWSKVNREHIARLTKEGSMRPPGLAAVAAAKMNGQWDAAYDSPKNMQVPLDFIRELKKDKKAYVFYKTLNRANNYAIAWRLATAKKPETRAKHMDAILTMLKQGRKFH